MTYRADRRCDARAVSPWHIEIAQLLDPELTTVAIPGDAIGRTAVERLLLRLRGNVAEENPYVVESAGNERA